MKCVPLNDLPNDRTENNMLGVPISCWQHKTPKVGRLSAGLLLRVIELFFFFFFFFVVVVVVFL